MHSEDIRRCPAFAEGGEGGSGEALEYGDTTNDKGFFSRVLVVG